MTDEEFFVQTRSESNGLRLWRTLEEALAHAKQDNTVWKISFPLASGERIRLVVDEIADGKLGWVWEKIELPVGGSHDSR